MSDAGFIAVIGMGCRLPGADTPEQFWQNLQCGVESIHRLTEADLHAAGVSPEEMRASNYVRAKGVIDRAEEFDAAFFGFSPREAALVDPQQRIFLECASSALEHAGYDGHSYPGSIGVYAGSILSVYLLRNLWPNRDLMAGAGSFQTALGNDPTFLASRTAYQLGLRGASISVGTACSTSLVAVHLACQSLLTHETDMALAGGVSIHLPLTAGYRYEDGGILSPDGHCRPFDAAAQGTVSSDGAGVVVLKRLEDALADGDTVHAVIRGSAVNNDGAVKIGYTAPGVTGQAQVIAEALAMAGVEPRSLSLVETHGAGTLLGDPIEFAALVEAFGDCGPERGFCALGAVKSNIGHVDAAAGIAGFIKTVLALDHRAIPATLHFSQPNPKINLGESPFFVNNSLLAMTGPSPLRAGVSSFGIGGTNVHVVLEESPAPEHRPLAASPDELLQLSARTEEALEAASQRLADHLEQHPEAVLADVAHTLRVGRRSFDHRRAVVCADREEAIAALRGRDPQRVLHGAAAGAKSEAVFLFPGLGDHYPGMGWEFYCAEPTFRETVDLCCETLRGELDRDLRDVLYARKDWKNPAPSAPAAAQALDLRAMLGRAQKQTPPDLPTAGQPAIFVVEVALAKLLMSWGIEPAAMIGHSIGEFSAACISGVLSLPDALHLVAARAQLIEARVAPGAMLAAPLSESELMPLLPRGVSLAAVNGSSLCIASGEEPGIAGLEAVLTQRGCSAQRLRSTHAYHSSMMDVLAEPLAAILRRIPLHPPRIPYISCSTGTWITAAQATDPEYWANHLCRTVRFQQGLSVLLEQDHRIFVEVGPGQGLTAHAVRERTRLRRSGVPVVPCMRWSYSGESEFAVLLRSVAQMWFNGVAMDKASLLARPGLRRIPLPTYPFERQRYWIDPPLNDVRRSSAADAKKRSSISEWFYLPYWKPAPILREKSSTALGGPWLIFTDEFGRGSALAGRLRSLGERVTTVRAGSGFATAGDDLTLDPANGEDFDHLAQRLAAADALPARVVHLWSLLPFTGEAPSSARFRALQTTGYETLMHLLRVLIRSVPKAGFRLDIVSNQLFPVDSSDTLVPEKACLRGPALVAPQEHPGLTCRIIDTEIAPNAPDRLEPFLEQLLAELAGDAADREVAYRRGRRWTPAWQPAALSAVEPTRSPFRRGGVYAITGGLGGVGLALAEHLVRTAGAKLALIGRSAFPPRPEWPRWLATHPAPDRTALAMRKIEELEALGSEILILQADVADEQAMGLALAQIDRRFGELHGLIHAAGSIGSDTFREIVEADSAQAEAQFKAKVHGLLVLARLLAGRPLDFCLLTSSLSAILGGLGFAAYSAANLFMDAFVCSQELRAGPRWISVNLDSWELAGARPTVVGVGGTVSQFVMKPDEGAEAIERILAERGLNRVAVSTGDLQARFDVWVNRDRQPAAAVTLHDRPALATAYQAPRSELETRLAAIWEDLFGIAPIGITDNFFALGGHSLLATQLNARLYAALGVEMTLARLLQAPTIADLGAAIVAARADSVETAALESMLAEIEQMPDDAQPGREALLSRQGAAGDR